MIKDYNFSILIVYLYIQYMYKYSNHVLGYLYGNFLAGKLVVQLIIGPSFRICDHMGHQWIYSCISNTQTLVKVKE